MCWYLKIPQNSYSLSSLVMTPKSIFLIILTLFAVSSSWGRAPSEIVGKKVTVNGFVSELNTSFNHQFFFVSSVNHVGLYNIGQSNEDWSQERYHYRKIGEQSAQLTIINFDGHQTRLVLSFDSPTSGSVTGAYYDLEGNEQWSDLVGGTWTAEDFDRSEIPEDEQLEMGLSDGLIRFSIGLDNDIKRTYQLMKQCMLEVGVLTEKVELV